MTPPEFRERIRKSISNVIEETIQFLSSRGIRKIRREPHVLDESLLSRAGISFTHEPGPELLVGMTEAVCGLADTGSILETEGPGSPLHASLLPQTHIAVLKRSDILLSLPDAMPSSGSRSEPSFSPVPPAPPTSR